MLRTKLAAAIVTVVATSSVLQAQQATDWTAVTAIMGRPAAQQPGGVMRFSFPRSDLNVSANGVTLKPAFALGSWVAFRETSPGQVMVMGDLVLLDPEVAPVMRALQSGGVEQSALHNHVLNETPHVMYMHISAHGQAASIARTIHDALAKSATPLGAPSATAPASVELDTALIAKTLGITGRINGGVYQVSVPRKEKITEMGHEVPPSMGVATAINFQPTGGGRTAITGDFVLRGGEVNGVIRALQAAGIEVTALHSHLMDEEPRLYFMHFWANDTVARLSGGLRTALDLLAK